jgi:hypothetical protein
MAEFPDDIYTPRETENLSGIVYDPADKKNLYSEDFQNLGDEINAIETTLGTNPEGAYATVKAWLEALADAISGLVVSFLDLSDTPSSYSGQAGKVVAVNDDEDALEFIEQGGSAGFGDWTGKSLGTSYQADHDGFVVVGWRETQSGTSSSNQLQILTDSSNPPTTIRMIARTANSNDKGGMCCPVKSGDYYLVQQSGGSAVEATYYNFI